MAKETSSGFSYEQVRDAANRAANEIIAAADLDDTGCVDVINLMVNATMTFLTDPDESLVGVVDANYGVDGDAAELLEELLADAR